MPLGLSAQAPTLAIQVDHPTAKVSPTLYGLMTEEINFSYDGGLYPELVRDRTLGHDWQALAHWTLVTRGNSVVQISPDDTNGVSAALPRSLKVAVTAASEADPAGVQNDGFWGFPVRPQTTYVGSFYAHTDSNGVPVTISLVNDETGAVAATAKVEGLTGAWKQYNYTLKTGDVAVSSNYHLQLTLNRPATVWFNLVSLFPPTYHDRPFGDRIDLMEKMAAMHPKFLRLPGGNYLEGDYINERFNWKETIGDTAQRPGHRSPWNYWSTDGFGLMEYLNWCDDLKMEPLLAVYAGYSLKHDYIKPGPDLAPYVQDALDEIEYVTGDADTKWGALRARDGHAAPFPLHYVEIGNEEWFDRSGSYDGRFAQFYDAIKAKYPQLQIISTVGLDHPESMRVHSRTPDLIDEHYYKSQSEMEAQSHMYDTRPRGGPTKVFVGEWATRVGSPTPNMAGALGDAAWMCNMERNSDLVVLESYAPLFVNVSDLGKNGSMQWRSDLIGYDALTSYGSPSYYAQKMFSTHHGDDILATDAQDIPTYTWQPPARTRNGVPQPAPAARQLPTVYFDVTRDSVSGKIFLKIVNRAAVPQPLKIEISGVASVAEKGEAIVLKANNPDDTNSLQEPKKIIPVTEKVKGLGKEFTREFPAYSITILELRTK